MNNKDGIVIVYDNNDPIASAIAENIFSNKQRREMPNFVQIAFENAINNLPREVSPDFVKGLAEIAKKTVSYEKLDHPWEYSEDLEWFFREPEKTLEKIAKMEDNDDNEALLIIVGVLLSLGEYFSARGSQEVIYTMNRLQPLLCKIIKNRKEATTVYEYAGKNGKASILMNWFK